MSKYNRFSGKSISDIMSMGIDEFLSLSEKELRQATQRLASAANKRIKRLESSKVVSPALIEVNESGGKFSTKNKDELSLQVEFRRITNFLQSQSSTVTGSKNLEKEARRTLQSVYGININLNDFRELINNYKKMMEESPDYQSRRLRYKILKEFNVDLADNQMTTKEISDSVVSVLTRYYQPGGAQYDGFSEYFELT